MTPANHEILVNLIGGLMIAVAAISLCYPWKPGQPFASKLVHLPWAFIPLWIAYEALMPAHINIRIDLFILPPLLFLLIVIWTIKAARFRKLKQREAEHDNDGSQTTPSEST